MIYNLDQALRIIKSTMYHHKGDTYFPYFFIVGAGISVPEIPSASKIIDICKKTVQDMDSDLYAQYEAEAEIFKENSMKYYSMWIEYAYPNRINRSRLFKDLCRKSKISSANLMLAQILNSGQFANTVFTPNFDDSIKKALDLIGAENYFCAENTMDNLIISNQTKDIQVVHVHGTFNFYDCANLESEIDNVASQSGTISSARLLSAFLSNQAPIIVGYSGWENDVIMQCLKERLTYPTPLQYLWVCYDKKSYFELPNWIKENESVIFVVPDSDKGTCEDGCDSSMWNENVNIDTVDATMFFKRIISDNKIEPPMIFSEPYQYYSKKINAILPENEDVLHLRHWTQRLKLLESDDAFEQLVQKLETVYISRDYTQASDIIREMSLQHLTEANAEFVCTSLIRDFIRDEDLISSIEQKLNFHLSSLQFVKNNIHQLSNVRSLISTMRSILFMHCKYSETKKLTALFDEIIEFTKTDDRLLLIELTALAVKSDIVDKEYKHQILRDVISRCPDNTHDKKITHLKFKALCELSVSLCSSESISLIEEAEQLLSILESETLNTFICLKKSMLLSFIKDSDVQAKWIKEIFSILANPVESVDLDQYIEIGSHLSYIAVDYIKQYSKEYNVEDILIKLINDYSVDESRCHLLMQYSQCCKIVCGLSDEPTIVKEYCERIMTVARSFPHKCHGFLNVLRFALQIYLVLPEDRCKTSEKISALQDLKKNAKTNHLFWNVLESVYAMGLISDFDVLTDDIEYINEQKRKATDGYNMYCEGKRQEAEQIFSELLNCKIYRVADSARTNLAYMVRRNEAVSEFDFEELIQQIAVLSSFDYVNIVLYYNSKNELENELYRLALSEIKKLSEDEKASIIKWWDNIEIVGQEESEYVLSLLEP